MVMEMVDPEVVKPYGRDVMAEDARKVKPKAVVATTTIWIEPRPVRPDEAVKEVKKKDCPAVMLSPTLVPQFTEPTEATIPELW